jgi:hypothetical protein
MTKTAKCPHCGKRFNIEGFERKNPEWCYSCNHLYEVINITLQALMMNLGNTSWGKYNVKQVKSILIETAENFNG